MKKLFFTLLLISGTAWARNDSGAEAFVTGFANGFNQARYGGQPYQAPAQVPVYQPQVGYVPQSHIDAVNNYGTSMGMNFSSMSECRTYVRSFMPNGECVVSSY